MRRSTYLLLLLGTGVLVGACSCGCGSSAQSYDATSTTGRETSMVQVDVGPASVPCPHVYFGEVEPEWSLSGEAQALVSADLDGDGLSDLVVTQDRSEIIVLRNQGRHPMNGGKAFEPPKQIEASNSMGVAVTDWNGDGRPDLVGRSNRLLLLENKGDLRFEVVDNGVQVVHGSDHLRVADMDGDGREDIILYGGGGISIYPAPDANGVLGEPFSVDLGAVGLRRGDVGDLDKDGVPDLVVAGFGGEPLLMVAFGDGRGGFERITPYVREPLLRGSEAAIVDVDRDGIPDVLIAASTMEPSVERYFERKPRLVWMRGTGGGQLEEAAVVELPVGAVGFSVEHADLDGDGGPEIVVLGGGYIVEGGENIPGAYHLLTYRDGALELLGPSFIDAGQAWGQMLLEDVDGDGRKDFVRASGGVAVHWGCPP